VQRRACKHAKDFYDCETKIVTGLLPIHEDTHRLLRLFAAGRAAARHERGDLRGLYVFANHSCPFVVKTKKNVDTFPAYPITSPLYFAGKNHFIYEKEIHFAISLL
jgi:hypothetical protein